MSFETAIKALMDGKKIKRKNDSAWYTKDSVIEYSITDFYKEFMEYDEWVISD